MVVFQQCIAYDNGDTESELTRMVFDVLESIGDLDGMFELDFLMDELQISIHDMITNDISEMYSQIGLDTEADRLQDRQILEAKDIEFYGFESDQYDIMTGSVVLSAGPVISILTEKKITYCKDGYVINNPQYLFY